MELYIEPIRPKYNSKNGRFLKGNVPHNKGKKWSEYMDMRKARKVKRIGMMNLKGRTDIGGWNKKQVIGIKNGQFFVFESAAKAAKILEIERRNISHCCKGKRKHCGGFRWFFEKDYHLWKNLI